MQEQQKTTLIKLYLIFWRKRRKLFHMRSVSSLARTIRISGRFVEHSFCTFSKRASLRLCVSLFSRSGFTLASPAAFKSNLEASLDDYWNMSSVKLTRKKVFAREKRVSRCPITSKLAVNPPTSISTVKGMELRGACWTRLTCSSRSM